MKLPPSLIHLKDRAVVTAKKIPWWGWAGIGVGSLMLFGKGRDMIGGAWDTSKNAALADVFAAMGLTDEMINAILSAAQIHGVSPLILYGIGHNETRWGRAQGYVQDTGDWTARAYNTSSHWENVPGVKLVDDESEKSRLKAAGWSSGGISGTWVIPEDELGWGRGITQLDYNRRAKGLNYHDIHTMVEATAKYFGEDHDAISKLVAGVPGWDSDAVVYAAIAAYNRGLGGVLKNIERGDDAAAGSNPDGQYAQLALDKMNEVLAKIAA